MLYRTSLTPETRIMLTFAVFFKDRREKIGGVKQEWKKVRRLLVGVDMGQVPDANDDDDDFGEDFVREMLRADSLADSLATPEEYMPSALLNSQSVGCQPIHHTSSVPMSRIASIFHRFQAIPGENPRMATNKTTPHVVPKSAEKGPKKLAKAAQESKSAEKKHSNTVQKNGACGAQILLQPQTGRPSFAMDICKQDRQALRCYMKKGRADDTAFDKLARRWALYSPAKRLDKLPSLRLPASIFQCCNANEGTCQCNKSAAAEFFAKVCSRPGLEEALLFLSKKRNAQYTQGLGL